jgi:hypothetical protein
VYELMEEGDYERLVRERRMKDDFVVDDGMCGCMLGLRTRLCVFVFAGCDMFIDGLGYYDDGEEHLGVEAQLAGNYFNTTNIAQNVVNCMKVIVHERYSNDNHHLRSGKK